MSDVKLICGNALDKLRELDDESVHAVITSPPYWGLRAYGTEPQIWTNGREPCAAHTWENETWNGKTGGTKSRGLWDGKQYTNASQPLQPKMATNTCSVCGAWRGELGLEPTPELYVAHLVTIFREARRVLRDDGVCFINLGDSYANIGHSKGNIGDGKAAYAKAKTIEYNKSGNGLKNKDLVGIPWRVAFALQADGWYLRQDIIWNKPNPMPESVRDRCTKAHEYIFLLTKSARYYWDADAIREPQKVESLGRLKRGWNGNGERDYPHGVQNHIKKYMGKTDDEIARLPGRNRRSVWTVTTHGYAGAHFATFPPKLIEPMVLAGCPAGGTILDPFSGAGTTGLVALQHGRDYIGIELKQEYIEMTRARIAKAQTTMVLA